MIHQLNRVEPDGIFITGDISTGKHVEPTLHRLASEVSCPIYFVLGNHDYWGRTFDSVHDDMRRLMNIHPNLHWMDERGVISLKSNVGLIGSGGWYDCNGDTKWMKWTLDWRRIYDFDDINNMDDRIKMFQEFARLSAIDIEKKLFEALLHHKTVYILTHVPPWKEATRDIGTWAEKFWLPYNSNETMGKAIQRVGKQFKKRNIVVLSGHTHTNRWVRVKKNIECRVNDAKWFGSPNNDQLLVI